MTVHYCDNYEELTGKQRDNAAEPAVVSLVETKVVEAPETPEPQASDVPVETK